MLWHSAASCKVSQISQFWHFSQELLVWSWSNFDFCLCCGTLQPLAMFPNFLHFFAFFSGTTGLILIKLWFLFMLWHSAANCKVSKFSFLHFSYFLLWFLFMLWHSTANCKVSKFSSLFAFFSGTTGLILINLWFLFMLWHSAANCKVSKFSHFLHFSQELLVWSWSNFYFCLCCGTLQPIVKFHKFSSLFCIFLRNYWCYLDQTFIFVYAVALCSQL